MILKHKNAQVRINELPNGKRRISVRPFSKDLLIPTSTWETFYPVELIDLILKIKGPAYLCDEIMRDEYPDYVKVGLESVISDYTKKELFKSKNILDFGCGSGASTIVLAMVFPESRIAGVELERDLLLIAEMRARFYNLKNINFVPSETTMHLPSGIGKFDLIVLNGVYEHLLEKERRLIIPEIWSVLNPGGVMFVNATPFRYCLIESHTSGLPFVNYLSDRLAHAVVSKFSRRFDKTISWEYLLRAGIRGVTEQEIISTILKEKNARPNVLKPLANGLNDRIDLWFASGGPQKRTILKRVFRVLAYFIHYPNDYGIL